MEGLATCFEDLPDPRIGSARRHDLLEIIVVALCAVLCAGQNAWDKAPFRLEPLNFRCFFAG